jgi:hypothetical protein
MSKPRRTKLVNFKVSEKEYHALSEQGANENLASLSDYIRKAGLDRAGYKNATQRNP